MHKCIYYGFITHISAYTHLSMRACILLISALAACPLLLHAEDQDESFLKNLVHRSIITLGVAYRTDELKIHSNSLDGEGILVNERGFGPMLTVGLENTYFGESNWGYTAIIGLALFEMDEQKVNGEIVDLGTSTDGELFFIAPSIFYMFGAKHYDGWYLKPGFALGLGYLRTSGDVLLTDLAGSPRYEFDTNAQPLSVSIGFFVEAGYNDWFLRFQAAGPVVSSSSNDISGTTIGLSIGYTFHPFREWP